jgi:hypothetical protein
VLLNDNNPAVIDVMRQRFAGRHVQFSDSLAHRA